MICITDAVDVKCLVAPNGDGTQNLVIGTLANNTDYKVYFNNDTTGRNIVTSGTSNGSGLLTIDISDLPLVPNNVYYLWVTEENVNIVDQENITVDGNIYIAFRVTFERVWEFGLQIVPATQTIEIA